MGESWHKAIHSGNPIPATPGRSAPFGLRP
jgi:hypothetical protein